LYSGLCAGRLTKIKFNENNMLVYFWRTRHPCE
jgi:hypothetical protein